MVKFEIYKILTPVYSPEETFSRCPLSSFCPVPPPPSWLIGRHFSFFPIFFLLGTLVCNILTERLSWLYSSSLYHFSVPGSWQEWRIPTITVIAVSSLFWLQYLLPLLYGKIPTIEQSSRSLSLCVIVIICGFLMPSKMNAIIPMFIHL